MTTQTGKAISARRGGLAVACVLAIAAGAWVFGSQDNRAPSTNIVKGGAADTVAANVTDSTPDNHISEKMAPPPDHRPNDTPPDTLPDTLPDTSPTPAAGFDLVRVDAQGRAVIAGHAAPDSQLELTLDGAALKQVDVAHDGTFVALLDLPVDAPAALGLAPLDETGAQLPVNHSSQTVLINPPPLVPARPPAQPIVPAIAPEATDSRPPPAAPQILLADDQGITVLQDAQPTPATAPRVAQVVIDAITYDTKGDVALSGRGQQGATLQVYLDNTPVQSGAIAASGQWRLPLPDVDSGVYTLRVDELAADGTVASRMETPFKREDPTQFTHRPGPKPAPRIAAITVQPGSTLWAIARDHLGGGPLYVRVFAANRDKIRDPDLIYPGQVFTIPDAQ